MGAGTEGDGPEESVLGEAELGGEMLGVVLGEVTSESTLVNTAERSLNEDTAKNVSNDADWPALKFPRLW
jgi:hypothetical protein